MCDPSGGSMTMAIMSATGAAMGASEQAKAEGRAEDARRKSQIELIKQLNLANADLNLEARDKAEQTRQQKTEINLKALRNRGTVAATVGESNLAGNSMERVKRVTEAETSRESMSVLDNYQRDYQTIFANQVGNVENTKSQMRSMAPAIRTSRIARALSVVNAGIGTYMAAGGTLGQGTSAPKPAPESASSKPKKR